MAAIVEFGILKIGRNRAQDTLPKLKNPGIYKEDGEKSLESGVMLPQSRLHRVARAWKVDHTLESGIPGGLDIVCFNDRTRVSIPAHFERAWIKSDVGELRRVAHRPETDKTEVLLVNDGTSVVLLPDDYCVQGFYRRVISITSLA